MPILKIRKPAAFLMILTLTAAAFAAIPEVAVNVSQPGASINPKMHGVFFEDINFAADGGLYAELVINRSFEFDKPLRGWRIAQATPETGAVTALRDETRPRNPRYLRVTVRQPGRAFQLINEGFRGMGIRQDAGYRFSLNARNVEGDISAIHCELVGRDQQLLGGTQVQGFSREWQPGESLFKATGTDPKAELRLWFEGSGTVDIDMVSLFPTDTWKGRKNGLRPDLVQLLADMKPGFLRFPGGCIVEGFDLSQRYQWKNTVGSCDQRVSTINRWNFEFKHRPTPDYYQSFGLGFYEFFLLAEDIGAEPMPIINIGMACQFNTAELVPMDQLQPYVQDALDLIEFANGPAASTWGALRSEMGHPAPFNLKMIGIGNEQWGPQYIERYKVFAQAIKEKYPDLELIAATGSDGTIFPNGLAEIAYLWSEWRKLKPEIVDEHFYRSPEWFLENSNWYNTYDRQGPKIFVGEYAAQSVMVGSPDNRNSWKCALYEAAFMTGLERNGDLVRMACYAPLFGHEEAWQWRPDLIWFDHLHSCGSANYYVQKCFSLNTGSRLLPVEVKNLDAALLQTGALHTSATLDEKNREIILKVVHSGSQPLAATVDLKGLAKGSRKATVIVLRANDLAAENSLELPKNIYPQEEPVTFKTPRFTFTFQPYSLTIIRLSAR